jgi:hypothetical protein
LPLKGHSRETANVRFWHKAAMREGKVRYERGAEFTIFFTVGVSIPVNEKDASVCTIAEI